MSHDGQPEARPRCRLLELPREIRDEIYRYSVAPTGEIWVYEKPCSLTYQLKLHRHSVWHHEGTYYFDSGFRLLQTCRQIHDEANALVLPSNTFVFTDVRLFFCISLSFDFGKHLCPHLVHIGFDEKMKYVSLEAEKFQYVRRARNQGMLPQLKTISFHIVRDVQGFLELTESKRRLMTDAEVAEARELQPGTPFETIEQRTRDISPLLDRPPFRTYLEDLRRTWAMPGDVLLAENPGLLWEGITRKLIVEIGGVLPAGVMKQNTVVRALDELHEAFWGELWVDGRLCYKDGVILEEVFEWNPTEEGYQVSWYRENDDEYWGRGESKKDEQTETDGCVNDAYDEFISNHTAQGVEVPP